MKAYLTCHRTAVAVVAGVVAALSFSDAAHAINDTIYKYSTPKTGYFTIDHTAMSPLAPGSNYDRNFADSLHLTTNGGPCFAASVNLPHGAKITAVAVAYRSGTGNNPGAILFLRKFSDGNVIVIALKEILDNSNTRKIAQLPITPELSATTVNNALFSYTFGLCLATTDNYFDGARITYTYTNAGD